MISRGEKELLPRAGGDSPGSTHSSPGSTRSSLGFIPNRKSCSDLVCIETKSHSAAFIQSSSHKQKVTRGSLCGWDGIFPLSPPVYVMGGVGEELQ